MRLLVFETASTDLPLLEPWKRGFAAVCNVFLRRTRGSHRVGVLHMSESWLRYHENDSAKHPDTR